MSSIPMNFFLQIFSQFVFALKISSISLWGSLLCMRGVCKHAVICCCIDIYIKNKGNQYIKRSKLMNFISLANSLYK